MLYESSDNIYEVREYLRRRFYQIVCCTSSVKIGEIELITSQDNIVVLFVLENKPYAILYTYKSARSIKGNYKTICQKLNNNGFTIARHETCGVPESYYIHNNIRFETFKSPPLLKIIEQYYGDTKSKRSNTFYINHIYEGLLLATPGSEGANLFTVHPIYQYNHQHTYPELQNLINEEKCINLATLLNSYNTTDLVCNLNKDIKVDEAILDAAFIDKLQNFSHYLRNLKDIEQMKNESSQIKYFANWFKYFSIGPEAVKLYLQKFENSVVSPFTYLF